jgi:hypothetical protein
MSTGPPSIYYGGSIRSIARTSTCIHSKGLLNVPAKGLANQIGSLTQATDTSNIRLVFAALKETILQNALKDSGIL